MIDKVGIVGCGVMGAGLAESCARAGLEVKVAVSRPASADAGSKRIHRSLERAVSRGKLSETDRDAVLGRISFTADLLEFQDRRLVIETVPEDEATKLDVFAQLDKVVQDPGAILASNTSSIPIARLAAVTQAPERVIGLHFFNPVQVLALVEVISSLVTAESVRERAVEFVTGVLGKQVVSSPDRAGFVVNGLLVPYLLGAVRVVESGFSTASEVDRGMTLGCAHPMGPLALIDLIGADVVVHVARALYAEYGEPLYAPPPLLVRMAESGLLGKKSGHGFYSYA
ncbi:3-hydroxybutyryl-CoA dehydrogenase [Amycolatopsis saalfeldensis]|uniref:3-hydroxybutyryl-CoA dehydrogenase n=1 Tax=Amycolatopsis saalfeldensis TaxID=394193 RepID=A0A1H8XCQ1_9PSEU|nr:3-hydroxybutyryl-CoA dehydrogenase [Amycolatopsis saalfeldensis]